MIIMPSASQKTDAITLPAGGGTCTSIASTVFFFSSLVQGGRPIDEPE